MNRLASILACALALLTFTSASQAVVLMVDFGSTTVTDAARTNSPYHTETPSFTDTSWNKLTSGDSGSLLYSDGTAATGVVLNLGSNTTTTLTAINLAANPTQLNAGTAITTGVYTSPSVGQDVLFGHNGADGVSRNIGVQFTGLAAGEYDIFVIARQTFSTLAHGMQVFAGSGSSGNFDFGGYQSETLTYAAGATAATAAWVDGENYAKLRLTITEGQALNIGIYGLLANGTSNDRAALNAIQIVSVPEPGALVLLAAGISGFMIRRRRPYAPLR